MEKLDNLIKQIDNEKCVKNIKKLNKEVFKDKELIDLVTKYNLTKDIKIKKELFSNQKFQLYKEMETEVNLLIMKINSKLKEISKGSSCSK